MIATRNNSQNNEKTIGTIKEITLYLNRQVGGLHGLKKQGWMHGYPSRVRVSKV